MIRLRGYSSRGFLFLTLHAGVAACVALNCAGSAAADSKENQVAQRTGDAYGKLPLSFEMNQGQADPDVKYLSRGDGYSLMLTDRGAVLDSATGRVRMSLTGAGPSKVRRVIDKKVAVGEDLLPGRINYFVGNDPSKWKADLPTYGRVRYAGVYPGVDLVYYGNHHQLEYDFVVQPGVSTAAIQMRFDGQKCMRVGTNGDLLLEGSGGVATLHKPVVYQLHDGRRELVEGAFKIVAGNTVGFRLGSYDHARELVIDPVLGYSTYLGGSGTIFFLYYRADQGNGIAVDTSGNAYVVGTTYSTDFPVTAGAYQARNKAALLVNGPNVFVSKLNASGTALIYSTYLGGTGAGQQSGAGDDGMAIAVDAAGNAYVTGSTTSLDFPATVGAFQPSNKDGQTAFLTKLNATGNGLVYSTYLGGSKPTGEASDRASAIAVDAAGEAYVTGSTVSSDFPITAGAFQTTYRASSYLSNVFVTKFNAAGSELLYSTYLGGSGQTSTTIPGEVQFCSCGDTATGIGLDSAGNSYVAGQTYSSDFPVTSGALQKVNRGYGNGRPNAFVTKLNTTGTAEVYSTLLGGSGQPYVPYTNYTPDSANAIAVDPSGDVYVVGVTNSTDFPVKANGLLPLGDGVGTAFVSKLNASGSALYYSSYLGGEYAAATAAALDADGDLYVTGDAIDGNFGQTPDALLSLQTLGHGQPFVAKVNPAGDALRFASLFGGTSVDQALGLALGAAGDVYVTGATASTDFPITSGAFQTVNKAAIRVGVNNDTDGNANAFVSKLELGAETTDYYGSSIAVSASPARLPQGQVVNVRATVVGGAKSSTPTGSVRFSSAVTSQPTSALPVTERLNSSGVAAWSTSTLSLGIYSVTASYSGDASHVTSAIQNYTSAATFRVVGAPAAILYHYQSSYQYTYGQLSNPSLVVEVVDASGYPLQGVTVGFSGAGLRLSSSTAVTDLDGLATVTFTTTRAGALTALASVSGLATGLSTPITVIPAPLTIFVHSERRLYGAANPSFPDTVTGLVGSETVTVTPQTTAVANTPVGNYPVTALVTGPYVSNYAVTVNSDAHLEIDKAPLYITANNYNSIYGATPPQPTQYHLTGFVNGETPSVVSGAPVLSTTVTARTPVGFTLIGVQIGTLTATNYYFSTYSNGYGHVQVIKASLKVTANNLTMRQGSAVPPLTYTITGFVNGETAAMALTGTPNLTTNATSSSRPGRYGIFPTDGSLAAGNYVFNDFGNGVLTVTP